MRLFIFGLGRLDLLHILQVNGAKFCRRIIFGKSAFMKDMFYIYRHVSPSSLLRCDYEFFAGSFLVTTF